MAIEEMVLLNMTFDRKDLDKVIYKSKDFKDFFPQPASKIIHNVKDVHVIDDGHVYTKLLDDLIQVAADLKLDLKSELNSNCSLDQKKTSFYLHQLSSEIDKIKSVQNELYQEKKENEMTLEFLNHLNLSNVNFDSILDCHYLKIRFGRLRKEDFEHVVYYDGKPFIFNKLGEDDHYIWCCYIVNHNIQLKVDNIFKAVGFEEIVLPPFVHGRIDEAKEELQSEIQAMHEYILRVEQELSLLRETHKIDLLLLYSNLSFLKSIEEYKTYVVDFKNKCAIYGFIPKRLVQDFEDNLKDISSVIYQELPADVLEQQDIVAPTLVHNVKWISPFEMISKVNIADVVDTTIAFAMLYFAVFAFFFGDLGVGFVLSLLGLFMRKKDIGQLLFLLGVVTLLGGIVYGQAFYTITLYPALVTPLSPVFKLVDGAVLLCVGGYTINVLKKIYVENSNIERYLSMKGLCGLIIVYALLIYLGCVVEAHMNMSMMPFAIVIVACLVLILAKSMIKKRTTH